MQDDTRTQFGATSLLTEIGNLLRRKTGRFVHNFANRQTFDEVGIVRRAFAIGDDRHRVRIPIAELLTLLDRIAFVGQQFRTVRNAVTRFLTAIGIDQNDFAITVHDDRTTFAVRDDVLVLDLHDAVERSFDRVRFRPTLRRTTNVEGTHRKLSPRFAD